MENDFFLHHLEDDDAQDVQTETIKPSCTQPQELDISDDTSINVNTSTSSVSADKELHADDANHNQGKGDTIELANKKRNQEKSEIDLKSINIAINHVGGGDCASKIAEYNESTD